MSADTITYAKVIEILGRTSSRGGVTQVKVELQGKDKRTLVRNTIGPIRKDDVIVLMECEREARRMK
ncbi:Ribosomal protein S28 [Spironucleus salmonicida]|uniref:Ribosomal protein S28 n=1 Tax=Spironucleus salmonicida TaxID=348837 RepID=V6LKM0_9EUKA|nr:Ribosomal protein S28 [Spironucleus salmonicida]|eukprot:EST45165.1 Ribosomal protein S28 [Spironucleus salmonicida]